ncbi:hypothetical protein BAURA86_04088, partial [Brevibacterium aurantiacum]
MLGHFLTDFQTGQAREAGTGPASGRRLGFRVVGSHVAGLAVAGRGMFKVV